MMPFDPNTDDEFLLGRMINDKDRQAFELLFIKYYPSLRQYIARRIRSAADAEDLAQSVFLRLWETRARYEKGRPVEAYLFTVARNAIVAYVKRKRRQLCHALMECTAESADNRSVSGCPAAADPDGPNGAPHILAVMRARLSPESAQAVRLRFFQGLSTR